MSNRTEKTRHDDVFGAVWCLTFGGLFLLAVSGCSRSELILVATPGVTADSSNAEDTVSFTAVLLDKPFEGNETDVSAADLNGDGTIDLVFSSGRHVGGQSYAIYNPLEKTRSVQKIGNSEKFSAVSVADVNGDGWPDALLAGDSGKAPSPTQSKLYLNPGTKNLQPWSSLLWESENPLAARNGLLSDLDGSGNADILIATLGNQVSIYQNDSGSFPKSATQVLRGPVIGNAHKSLRAVGLAVGDLNGDGLPDVVFGTVTGSRSRPNNAPNGLSYNETKDGVMSYANPASALDSLTDGNKPDTSGMAIADLNNDGHLDIVTANGAHAGTGKSNGPDVIHWRNSSPATTSVGPPSGSRLAVPAFINDDKAVDLVLVFGDGSPAAVYLNDGSGGFPDPKNAVTLTQSKATSHGLAIADINGDGAMDIVVAFYGKETKNVIYLQKVK